jgi:3-methyladenine DNA glycosylase AlkD
MPHIRRVVKSYRLALKYEELERLLASPYHEERMLALLILVARYKLKRMGEASKEEIYDFYISHLEAINNWDLVDVTAPHIVGVHLIHRNRTILYQWAESKNLWHRRLSIISTFALINHGEYADTLRLAEILRYDKHDLIHKAVGWALRNVGIKSLETEVEFLRFRYKQMPRTMLRYAIEKFEEPLRQRYLNGEV